MKILITGSSKGIGKAVAQRFLDNGFEVAGLDLLESAIKHPYYQHFICDISKKKSLPNIKDVDYIFNNAGTQNNNDINNNLVGSMNVTEKYAFQPGVKAVLFNASASAHSGFG